MQPPIVNASFFGGDDDDDDGGKRNAGDDNLTSEEQKVLSGILPSQTEHDVRTDVVSTSF